MKLIDLVRRETPAPWSEGDNIPWNEPGFSRRMLQVHLSQDWDAASRRAAIIDEHVRFIHERVLAGRPGQILDMACGPGLYTHRLAWLGHTIHGIDFSPASIEYARQTAEREGLAGCSYQLCDLRAADFGGPAGGYDLAMFVFGEFNVFGPQDVRLILRKAHAALKPGGTLLLEPTPEGFIRKMGAARPNWYTQESGLFSDQPHMMLEESFWDETRRVATNRYYVVDLASEEVTRFAASYQAYSEAEYVTLLAECGFGEAHFFPNLRGTEEIDEDLFVIRARGTYPPRPSFP